MAIVEPVNNEVKKSSLKKLKTLLFKIFIVFFIVFVLVLLVFTIAEVRNNKEKDLIKDLYGDWAKWKYLYESVKYKTLLSKEKKDNKVSDLILLYIFAPSALIGLSTIGIYYKYTKTVRAEHEKDNLDMDNKKLEEIKTEALKDTAFKNEFFKYMTSLTDVERKKESNTLLDKIEEKVKIQKIFDDIPFIEKNKIDIEKKINDERDKINKTFETEINNEINTLAEEIFANDENKDLVDKEKLKKIIVDIMNDKFIDKGTKILLIENNKIKMNDVNVIGKFDDVNNNIINLENLKNRVADNFKKGVQLQLIKEYINISDVEDRAIIKLIENNNKERQEIFENDKVKNIFDSNDSIKYIKDGDNLLNFKEEKKNAIDNFNDPEKERTIEQKKQILKTITSSIELANTNDVIFSEEIKNKMFEQSNAIAAQETVVQTSLNEFNHYIKKNFEFTSKEEHIIKEINKFFESKHKSKPFSSFYDKFYEVEVKMSNVDDTRTYYLNPDEFHKYEKKLKMLNNFLTEFNENSLKLDESKKNYINNLKLLDEMKERLKKPSEYVDKKTHSTRPTKPRFPPMPKLIGK